MALVGIKKIIFITTTSALAITAVVGSGIAISNAVSANKSEQTKPISWSEINSEAKVDLNKLISSIDQSKFELYKDEEKKEKLDRNNIFAYLVKDKQLNIDLSNIPNEIQTTITLDNALNTVKELNDGKLHIDVVFVQKNLSSNTKQHKFLLEGFKKASDELINLLGEKKEEFVLTISPTKTTPNTYYSIEQLNANLKAKILSSDPMARNGVMKAQEETTKEVNGLTAALWESSFNSAKDLEKLIIQGQVKLEKITKETNDIYFHLVSIQTNNPLRLVKEVDNNTQEVLLSEIKIKNLLATDVSVVPIKHLTEKTNKLVEDIKTDTNKKNYLTDNSDPSLNRYLQVNLAMNQTPANNVFVKPYVINKDNGLKDNNIEVEIVIGFGSGTNIKQYKTSLEEDRKVLKEAEFSFNIYSKNLNKEDLILTGDEIKKDDHKLSTYLTAPKYSGFNTQKPSGDKSSNNNYHLTSITSANLDTTPIKVDAKKSSMPEMNVNNKAANFIVFADYSYKGIDMMKVAFTPNVSLIHLENSSSNESGK